MESAQNPIEPEASTRQPWLDLFNELKDLLVIHQQTLDAVAQRHGISSDSIRVLHIVALTSSTGTLHNQKSLSKSVRVSPAKMSGLLESMRERALLFCVRSHADRRNQVWHVTPQGLALLDCLNRQLPSATNLLTQISVVLDEQRPLEKDARTHESSMRRPAA